MQNWKKIKENHIKMKENHIKINETHVKIKENERNTCKNKRKWKNIIWKLKKMKGHGGGRDDDECNLAILFQLPLLHTAVYISDY